MFTFKKCFNLKKDFEIEMEHLDGTSQSTRKEVV